jgi:hypothetical protein
MIYLQVNQTIRLKSGDEIMELWPGQVVTCSDDQAQKLLNTGKAVKVEPPRVMTTATEEVAGDYISGCVDWIQEQLPPLWADIRTIEDAITQEYLAGRNMQPVVNQWVDLWKHAIGAYCRHIQNAN